jgi:nitrogen fixation protein
MTIGFWFNAKEISDITDAIKSKNRIESVILNNGMELNFRKLVHVTELSVIANASKNYRKIFNGEINVDDLLKQIS